MENVYKRSFLKDISTHAELLVYDWSNGGDTELVVEDIERIGMPFFKKIFSLTVVLTYYPNQSLKIRIMAIANLWNLKCNNFCE